MKNNFTMKFIDGTTVNDLYAKKIQNLVTTILEIEEKYDIDELESFCLEEVER